ncbi:HAD family phosphatase [Mucilaginibacter sp. BT774]|uniref:HAD family hydrolase n=1 Tax=Mucilaginibacter sp. BT774 TaxID=3062276 RepID=UPI0026757EC8|nr:HAD family phosphatase [Mucilaginibacter sp. BT774]MDO3626996.1 HAD family phosphatase [Mucilaginibacter sp. BT774]
MVSQKRWALEYNESVLTESSPREKSVETTFAAIFDMDGTLIDNTPFHFISWQALFRKYHKDELSRHTYYTEISGVPIMETLKRIFGADHDEAYLKELLREKEEFYRQEYAPHLVAIKGLENFLAELKTDGVKMAMATSATVEDIDFILNKVPIRDDFNEIVNSSMVIKPKPDPQIFLKAAELLNIPPGKCVVFEDSLAGIKAANAAGMKVVGITTGHPASDLYPVDLVIDDYTNLTPAVLAGLFNGEEKDERESA